MVRLIFFSMSSFCPAQSLLTPTTLSSAPPALPRRDLRRLHALRSEDCVGCHDHEQDLEEMVVPVCRSGWVGSNLRSSARATDQAPVVRDLSVTSSHRPFISTYALPPLASTETHSQTAFEPLPKLNLSCSRFRPATSPPSARSYYQALKTTAPPIPPHPALPLHPQPSPSSFRDHQPTALLLSNARPCRSAHASSGRKDRSQLRKEATSKLRPALRLGPASSSRHLLPPVGRPAAVRRERQQSRLVDRFAARLAAAGPDGEEG